MIDKDYNVKISDFGISSKLNIDQSHISIVFRKGKDYYQAPEMRYDFKVKYKSDLWTVGIILIELTLGKYIKELYKKKPG